MDTQLSFAVLFYTAPKSYTLLDYEKQSCFYIIILDSCMSFLFVYSDNNYSKIRSGSIDCGHEGFWFRRVLSKRQDHPQSLQECSSCSRQSCSWDVEDFRELMPSWHRSPMLYKSGWSLMVWRIYFCVCLLFCPLFSDHFHNYRQNTLKICELVTVADTKKKLDNIPDIAIFQL